MKLLSIFGIFAAKQAATPQTENQNNGSTTPAEVSNPTTEAQTPATITEAGTQRETPETLAQLNEEQKAARIDREFFDRLAGCKGMKAAELARKQKEANDKAGQYFETAATAETEKEREAARNRAEHWQSHAEALATLHTEAEAREKAEAEAEAQRKAEALARIANATPEELINAPELAELAAEHKREQAHQKRTEATNAQTEAKQAEQEAHTAEVLAALAHQQAGTDTEEDRSLINLSRLQTYIAETITAALNTTKETMKKARAAFSDILEDEYNLSQVLKRMKEADRWQHTASFLDLVGVSTPRDKFTPAMFNAENTHPFLLVPTGEGLKVGTATANGIKAVNRWSVENVLKYIVTIKVLNDMKIVPEVLAEHREILNEAENALHDLKVKRDNEKAAREAEKKAREERKAAQTKTAEEVSDEELIKKYDEEKRAEEATQQAKQETAEAKQEADAARQTITEEKKKTRTTRSTATRTATSQTKATTRRRAARTKKAAAEAQTPAAPITETQTQSTEAEAHTAA